MCRFWSIFVGVVLGAASLRADDIPYEDQRMEAMSQLQTSLQMYFAVGDLARPIVAQAIAKSFVHPLLAYDHEMLHEMSKHFSQVMKANRAQMQDSDWKLLEKEFRGQLVAVKKRKEYRRDAWLWSLGTGLVVAALYDLSRPLRHMMLRTADQTYDGIRNGINRALGRPKKERTCKAWLAYIERRGWSRPHRMRYFAGVVVGASALSYSTLYEPATPWEESEDVIYGEIIPILKAKGR